MNAPRPSLSGERLAPLAPALALAAGIEVMAGALLGGTGLRDWRVYLAALCGVLLFAAGAAFTRFFDRETLPPPTWSQPAWAPPPVDAERESLWQMGWPPLLAGALGALLLGRSAALCAIGAALLLALYAAVTRPVWGVGFASFAAARGLNFLLGLSLSTAGLERLWPAALPVFIFALGWDLLRSARQPGAPPTTAAMAVAHVVGAVSLALYQGVWGYFLWMDAFPFLILLLAVSFPRFVSAVMLTGNGPAAEAVHYGALGLVFLEATLVAGNEGLLPGLAVAALAWPLHLALRRWPAGLVSDPR